MARYVAHGPSDLPLIMCFCYGGDMKTWTYHEHPPTTTRRGPPIQPARRPFYAGPRGLLSAWKRAEAGYFDRVIDLAKDVAEKQLPSIRADPHWARSVEELEPWWTWRVFFRTPDGIAEWRVHVWLTRRHLDIQQIQYAVPSVW